MTTQNDHKSGRIPMEMLSEFTLKILLSSVFNAFAALAPYPDNWGVGSDIHLMKKKHILNKYLYISFKGHQIMKFVHMFLHL